MVTLEDYFRSKVGSHFGGKLVLRADLKTVHSAQFVYPQDPLKKLCLEDAAVRTIEFLTGNSNTVFSGHAYKLARRLYVNVGGVISDGVFKTQSDRCLLMCFGVVGVRGDYEPVIGDKMEMSYLALQHSKRERVGYFL